MALFPKMTDENRAWHATWRPASGHPSGRYRVCRNFYPPLMPEHGRPNFQELEGKSGRIRLFHSRESAQRAADKANAADPKV